MRSRFYLFFLGIGFFCFGCVRFTPKPNGYIRISFPEPVVSVLDTLGFSFNYDRSLPETMTISNYKKEGIISFDYKHYSSRMVLKSHIIMRDSLVLFLDSFDDAVQQWRRGPEQVIRSVYEDMEHAVFCRFYTIEGAIPTPYRWVITDGKCRVVEGLFMFDVAVNTDSLLPIKNYMGGNIRELIESFRWN